MYLVEGFQTLVGFSLTPLLFVRAKEVKPPEYDGGGALDTTVMNNVRVRTTAPKSLITVGAISMQCQWDPAVYFQLLSLVNVKQGINVRFPDGSSLALTGWVNKFTPASMKVDEFPLAELELMIASRLANGLETFPTFIVSPGAFAAGANGVLAGGRAVGVPAGGVF